MDLTEASGSASADSDIIYSNSLALVMKGGGVKGLAYIGALQEFARIGVSFNRFVGTSAGAITAALLAVGYTYEELRQILEAKDFSDFLDCKWYEIPLNILRDGGAHRGRTLTKWLDQAFAVKLKSAVRVNFGDIKRAGRHVIIYATRRKKNVRVFDSEDPECSEIPLAWAVRCSVSIPFLFVPEREAGLRVFDGGVKANFPIDQLLGSYPNVEFIGLYLGEPLFEGEDADEPSVFSDLLSIWTEAMDEDNLRKHKDSIVIIDPRPVKTTQFSLKHAHKTLLLTSGAYHTLEYIVRNSGKLGLNAESVEMLAKRRDEALAVYTSSKKEIESPTFATRWKWVFALFLLAIFLVYLAVDEPIPPALPALPARVDLGASDRNWTESWVVPSGPPVLVSVSGLIVHGGKTFYPGSEDGKSGAGTWDLIVRVNGTEFPYRAEFPCSPGSTIAFFITAKENDRKFAAGGYTIKSKPVSSK